MRSPRFAEALVAAGVVFGLGGMACGSAGPAAAPLGAGGSQAGSAPGGAVGDQGMLAGSSAAGQSVAGSAGTPSVSGGNAGAAATGGMGGSGPAFPPLLAGCDISTAHQRADSALAAALVNFWSGADQYLRATAPGNGMLAGYFPYAQVLDALLDGVERTEGQRYHGLIRSYYEGRAARGWLVDDYADQASMTLALLRAFDSTGDQGYLDTADALYQDLMTEWDTSCCSPRLGGLWSDASHTQKASAANAGAALAGARLAAITGKSEYLELARQVYGFWMNDMVEPASFAIYDHLASDGQRVAGSLTHHHGLMIGAALELNAATGEAHYLTEAHGFAHYLVTSATQPSSAGPVLYDGAPCTGQCAAYKGIAYRYLAQLFRRDATRQEYQDVLVAGAGALWAFARDPATNFFATSWAGPAPTSGGVEAQGSAAMTLNLHAMLCGADLTATPRPAGVYEAEEGFLDHVDAEAKKDRGFMGFGYVSAFTSDKQGFSIEVEVATAGQYSLAWRYTAGEGAGARSVLVGGQVVTETLAFPATADWRAWTNASSTVALPAGKSNVALYFDATRASKTSLDIDQLIVTPL